MQNELIQIIDESGLDKLTSDDILANFTPFLEQIKDWTEKAKELNVTDVSQVEDMKLAREARLAIRSIRIQANKVRVNLKENSIKYGKAVQGVYNIIESGLTPIEDHLEQQEKFAEVLAAKQKKELAEKREASIAHYRAFFPYGVDLGSLSEEDFTLLLNGAKVQQQAKEEQERQMEAKRLEQEKRDKRRKEVFNSLLLYAAFIPEFNGLDFGSLSDEDCQSIIQKAEIKREETRVAEEKIKQELDEKNKQLEEERKRADAERKKLEEKIRREREENQRLEAEIKRKKEEEERIRLEQERKAALELKLKKAAEKKLKNAPDKDKMVAYFNALTDLPIPSVSDDELNDILKSAVSRIKDIIEISLKNCENL